MSFNKTSWKHFIGFHHWHICHPEYKTSSKHFIGILKMSSASLKQNCTRSKYNKHFISLHLTHLHCSYIAEILPIHLTTCTYQSINQSLVCSQFCPRASRKVTNMYMLMLFQKWPTTLYLQFMHFRINSTLVTANPENCDNLH